METLTRGLLALAATCVLVACNLWLVRLIWSFRQPTFLISPVRVTGASSDGLLLANMLHARIRMIQSQLQAANRVLIPAGDGPPSASPTAAMSLITPLPPPSLPTEILDPPDVALKVSGVDIGGWLHWLQSTISEEKTLNFTIHSGKTAVADLTALFPGKEGIVWLNTATDASIPEIIDALAYVTIQASLGHHQGERVTALSHDEFRILTDSLLSLSDLAERQKREMIVSKQRFQEISAKLRTLSKQALRWPELDYMMALIAERAEEFDEAARLYRIVHDSAGTAGDALRTAIEKDEIARHIIRCDALRSRKPPVYSAQQSAAARQRIEEILTDAWRRYAVLFGVEVPKPSLQIIEDMNLYWQPDTNTIHAMIMADQMPDTVAHETANPFLFHILGHSHTQQMQSPESYPVALTYCAALASWYRQKINNQTAQTADWVLGSGFNWVAFGDKKDEPLRSLRSPSHAGTNTGIADYAQLDQKTEPHAAAGIGAKAFYETAIRIGTDAAIRVWIDALPALKANLTFPAMAAATIAVADRKGESESKAVRRAWSLVNVHP